MLDRKLSGHASLGNAFTLSPPSKVAAAPDGRGYRIEQPAYLATAGTGDVLAAMAAE